MGTVLMVVVTAASATSCGGDHNTFAPNGSQASRIAAIGWFMVVTAAIIAGGFYALLVYGLVRGGRGRRLRSESGLVIAGGIMLPTVVIVALSVFTLNALNDRTGEDAVHIEVVGHQFWWEVNYTDENFTTANEFEIPVGRPVDLTLRSADVIHSFWVPDLAGKIDMVPGHTNHLELDAESPGEYRGQCAEYCGIQHANMAFVVRAVAEDDYDAWTAQQSQPARRPETDSEKQGEQAFVRLPCASCHAIRGTEASGKVAPDLTHLANRQTLAAGALPMDAGHLGGWIANAQTIKPGNLMPPVPLTPDELRSLIDYLGSLR